MVAWVAKLTRRNSSVVWGVILILGIVAGIFGELAADENQASGLAAQALHASAALPADAIGALTGTSADASSPNLTLVRERLALLQTFIPDAHLLFIVRVDPATGKVAYLADSGKPGSGGLLPGDTYANAALLPALKRVTATNIPSAQGPVSDVAGTWAMGFAPITGGSAVGEVLGVDVAASAWTRSAWMRGFHDALYTWLILGLPFGILREMRGRGEQRKAIRNLLGAIEQSHSAVMIIDLDNCIEYVNASLCEQVGYTRRELLGRPWRDFQQPETPAERLADMSAAVRSGNSWRGEWFNRRRNGEIFPVRGVLSPVRDRDGRMTCFVAVFEDMTELKRSEAALLAALGRAEAGDRAKSQFLATMSHEVRTPLNGIVGFTSLLLGMPLTPEQDEYIQIIRSNGEALIQLTGDILDFAHIESGSLKLEPKPCSPRVFVEATLDLLAVQAAAKKIELVHWVDDSVPALIVVDEARVRQVLVNLAGNAVKFTEEGEVGITVRAEPRDGDESGRNWLLTFTVRDTGIGIAPEDHAKLFKPFNQVDVSDTRRHGGTGLGLAISKNLVEMMGGSIAVDSGAGRGSAFTFILPVVAEAVPARAIPDLTGIRVALVARPGPFRREFAQLARRWGVQLAELEKCADLVRCKRDLTFIEVHPKLAQCLAAQPGETPDPACELETGFVSGVDGRQFPWLPESTYAIVPITLARELRSAMRGSFAHLINKPLHHEAMTDLVSGARAAAAPEDRPSRFELNILVAEDNAINQRLVQKLLWNLGCTSILVENGRAAIDELSRAAEHYNLVLMDLHMPEVDGLEAIQKIRAGEAGGRAKGLWIAALTADARGEQKERVMAAGGNDYIVKPIKLGELADALRRYQAAAKLL